MDIVLDHITKIFPARGRKKNSREVVAADDLNFTISNGKLCGLLGPSGCGKSTALNMISGLLKPTSGEIFFGDQNVTELEPQERGVGMVFQNYALYPHMSVFDNICFPLENLKGDQKLSEEERKARVEEAARLVHIEDLLERKPKELSGGQQQRVAIARALVKLPKVLLLDEPLSNLDARLRLQTREEIRRIQQETGITTVFVTHDQDEAMSISDFIVVMKEGRVQQIDTPQKVYDNPANQFVAQFLGLPPINMFHGKIENQIMYIGENPVARVLSASDQPVHVGVRPEGFLLKEEGALCDRMIRTEITGRDMSIVSENEASMNPVVRSILSAEDLQILAENQQEVHFDLKLKKVFLFEPESGNRIAADLQPLQKAAEEIVEAAIVLEEAA